MQRLEVKYEQCAGGFSFSDAISRENQATALGRVNGHTMLLDHLLPYDCSYKPGVEDRLDTILASLALQGDILNYIIDGISGTYCFSVFSKGTCTRRWATEPGNVLCNEGEPVSGETPVVSKLAARENVLPAIFVMSEDEAHLFAVWEAFLGVSFQELVRDDAPVFQFCL